MHRPIYPHFSLIAIYAHITIIYKRTDIAYMPTPKIHNTFFDKKQRLRNTFALGCEAIKVSRWKL